MSLKDSLYLIDKHLNFYSLSFRLPTREDTKLSQHETLLEGQMVYNHKFTKYVYMIFNVICISGKPLESTHFSKKLTIIRNDIIVPLREVYPEEEKQIPFPLLGKDFFKLEKLDWFKKRIHHFTDEEGDRFIYENGKRHNDSTGIVFVPEEPIPSYPETFKKWKWPELNSVLFHLQLHPDPISETRLKLSLWENNSHIEYNNVHFDDMSTRIMLEEIENHPPEGIIIECSYNPFDGEWQYLRIRPDQTQATPILTAMRRLEIYSEGIDFEYLKNEILRGNKKPNQEH
uniref:mRNA capping enzyme adenylation domain-containing protein n=1 Tax=Arcella intermedia TaxID=1963864 RepID=A0A6B2LAF3_9EUKA